MENLTKVEKVLFNSQMNFFLRLGKTEQEATYRAWLKIQQVRKLVIEDKHPY